MTASITAILVPTDFSGPSARALDWALMLAERLDAAVHLLHVVEHPLATAPPVPEVYIGATATVRDALIDKAAERLARLMPAAAAERVRVTSEVLVGFPGETIAAVANRRGSDLIVMGTHGRGGLAHLLLGSVAEHVVRDAPCPVLTVREDEGDAAPATGGRPERELAPTD